MPNGNVGPEVLDWDLKTGNLTNGTGESSVSKPQGGSHTIVVLLLGKRFGAKVTRGTHFYHQERDDGTLEDRTTLGETQWWVLQKLGFTREAVFRIHTQGRKGKKTGGGVKTSSGRRQWGGTRAPLLM